MPNSEDVLRSIATLKSLGNGFEVVQVGSTQFLQTIPRESNQDLLLVIQKLQVSKKMSQEQIIGSLEWSPERAHRILVLSLVASRARLLTKNLKRINS